VAGVILYCRRPECETGYASLGEIQAVRPACGQPTRWGTSPPRAVVPGLRLTVQDRRWLREIKIAPE
jgi:hypothetical protein